MGKEVRTKDARPGGSQSFAEHSTANAGPPSTTDLPAPGLERKTLG